MLLKPIFQWVSYSAIKAFCLRIIRAKNKQTLNMRFQTPDLTLNTSLVIFCVIIFDEFISSLAIDKQRVDGEACHGLMWATHLVPRKHPSILMSHIACYQNPSSSSRCLGSWLGISCRVKTLKLTLGFIVGGEGRSDQQSKRMLWNVMLWFFWLLLSALKP